MDILIKSFNRPYYLDRCLYSIKKHITGYNTIFILDDGTPEKYLLKIQEKYPDVKILKSDLYTIKSNEINNLSKFEIPINFWVSSVKKASDYFLLLEEDFWAIEDLDLVNFNLKLDKKQIVFLKLMWLGNPKLTTNRIKEKLEIINIIKSKLLTKNPFLFKLIFSTYGYGVNKIMRFLKLNTLNTILPYYNIYSVSGSIFKKNYFISLWNSHQNIIDEKLQIFNALKFLEKYPKSQIAHSAKEYFKTGFKSSSTFGISTKNLENNFELLEVNGLLNESWFNNNFNTIKSLPEDLNEPDIINILKKADNKLVVLKWKDWMEKFKQQYQDFGCKVE